VTISSHRQLLDMGAEVTLLKLDLTPIGVSSIWYFCNDVGVTFAGQVYEQVPFEFSEIERNASGETITPRISLPNTTKFASALVVEHKDAVGAELTRIKTFQRFLDTRATTFGVERVVNGDFAGGTANFATTTNSTLSVVAGKGRSTSIGANLNNIGQAVAGLTVGKKYLVSIGPYVLGGGMTGAVNVYIGSTSANNDVANVSMSLTATTQFVFTATATTMHFYAQSQVAAPGAGGYIDVASGTAGTMPNETADATAILTEDVFVLEQKVALNKVFAQWELRALADTGDRKVPGRICMKEICPYVYRTWDGAQFVSSKIRPCPYASATVFRTIENEVTADPALDACDHKVDGGCKARETGWPSGILGFGGFPGMSRYRIG
jgi:lambda family phage minor tail protein L